MCCIELHNSCAIFDMVIFDMVIFDMVIFDMVIFVVLKTLTGYLVV